MKDAVIEFWEGNNQSVSTIIARRPPECSEEATKAAMIWVYEQVEVYGRPIPVRERPWLVWSKAREFSVEDYRRMRDAAIHELEEKMRNRGVRGLFRRVFKGGGE